MKKIALAAMLMLGMAGISVAHPGYHITLKMPGVKDSVVFLVHYYGKPLPTIYKTDSARFDKKGVAEFNSTDPEFTGGIYIMLLSDHKTYFEFLLNSGDDMAITAPIGKLPEGLEFKNSPENVRFMQYVSYLKGYGEKQQEIEKQYKEAKTAADTSAARKKAVAASKELNAYRKDYEKKYPNTLLSNIFSALESTDVPEGDHYLEDGKTKDSTFAYRYYKSHFWDGFNFQDDRLVYTPIYDGKLEEYFGKLVMPWPDSVEHEGDMLLKKAKGSKDVFKYTLWWLTRRVEDSKIMGMDEAFVYFVENYYMKGDAFWLSNEELGKYLDRAQKIAPNVIGNLAPEVKIPGFSTGKEESVLAMKANYTLLIFYSPTCGHCQHELPEIDSLYKAVLKKKGVKVFTVAIDGDEKQVSDFISKNKLEDWTNTWDKDHTGDYRSKYDVYSTPTIYLLDDKKIIRGKRLDHSNIANLLEMLEKKNKEKITSK